MKKIAVLLLFLFCAGYAQTPTSGLVAWYPLNSTPKDESGFGNNGRSQGVYPSSDHADVPNLACHFTGVNSYILIDSTTTLDTQFTAITLSAWVNPYSFPAHVISKRHYTCPSSDIALFMDIDSLHVTLGRKNFSFYYDTMFYQFGWNHVAASWDGDSVKVYANGYLFGSAPYTGSLSWNRQGFYLGKDSHSNTYLSGVLDEIRIYNRALGETEIQALRDYTDTVKFLYVISPNGGEKLLAKQKRDISWVANLVEDVKLEYTTDNGANWQTLVSSIPAVTGKYQWVVPQLLFSTCLFRVSDVCTPTFKDVSDSVFSIIDTVAYVDITVLLEAFYNEYTDIMVPDVIYVSLRKAANPDSIVDYSVAYLDSTGRGMASFLYSQDGSYYIVINHRNHIETWSSALYPIARGSTLTLNFSTDSSLAYGHNMVKHNNRWCIYAGDVNQDGYVDPLDYARVAEASSNYVTGYVWEDANGDGYIDPLDFSVVDQNSFHYIGVKKPGSGMGRKHLRSLWQQKPSIRLLSPFAK